MKISKRMTRMKCGIFACVVFCVFSVNVFAARSVVSDPTKTEAQLKLEEKAKADEGTDDAATTENLAEIGEGIDKFMLPEDTSLRFNVKELRISGNTLLSTEKLLKNIPAVYNASGQPLAEADGSQLYDFQTIADVIANPGRDREVSTKSIQGFTQYILSVYQKKNYGGIYVYVPSDAIIDGSKLQDEILPIAVLEATVASVSITHMNTDNEEVEKGYLSDSAMYNWSPTNEGEVVNRKKLDDYVNLLNLNPDRYVSAIISSGGEPNSIAVGYNIYEANPWHFFWQIDNSGTKDRQWTPRIGVINTNLLGIDDTFTATYQAPWDSDIAENYSVFGSYDFPIWTPRLRLNLFGGYSQFDISPETGNIDFLGNGDFYGGTLRLNVLQANKWFFDITGTLSHERSKVTPSLFPQFLGTDLKMDLWGWGVDVHHRDDMSDTSLRVDRLTMYGGSDQSEFTLARTGAETDFNIYTASANHTQYLDEEKVQRAIGSFRWITPDTRMAPSKMTSFGGMYTVRGYDEYEITADGGILASAQYEFDLVAYDKAMSINEPQSDDQEDQEQPFLRKLAPLAFMDYGLAKMEEPLSTEQRDQELLSVGGGLLVELGDNFSGAVYYGYPLIETANTRVGKGRVNVGLMMRW